MIPDQKGKPVSSSEEKIEGKVRGYGGYSTRFEYERSQRRQKRFWMALSLCLIFLVLGSFSVLGLLTLARGDLFRSNTTSTGEGNSAIRVPTYSEMVGNVKSPEEIVKSVSLSLVTVEVEFEDSSFRHGTGFLISEDGKAVCATSLFEENGAALSRVTVYTEASGACEVDLTGRCDPLGIQLLRLRQDGVHTPVPVGEDHTVERGEILYVLGAVSQKLYYGTALSGMAASVGQNVLVGQGDLAKTVPLIYMEVTPNDSLWGAPVVDESGNTVGFCTDAVSPNWNGLVTVIPIDVVYSTVNEILANP